MKTEKNDPRDLCQPVMQIPQMQIVVLMDAIHRPSAASQSSIGDAPSRLRIGRALAFKGIPLSKSRTMFQDFSFFFAS